MPTWTLAAIWPRCSGEQRHRGTPRGVGGADRGPAEPSRRHRTLGSPRPPSGSPRIPAGSARRLCAGAGAGPGPLRSLERDCPRTSFAGTSARCAANSSRMRRKRTWSRSNSIPPIPLPCGGRCGSPSTKDATADLDSLCARWREVEPAERMARSGARGPLHRGPGLAPRGGGVPRRLRAALPGGTPSLHHPRRARSGRGGARAVRRRTARGSGRTTGAGATPRPPTSRTRACSSTTAASCRRNSSSESRPVRCAVGSMPRVRRWSATAFPTISSIARTWCGPGSTAFRRPSPRPRWRCGSATETRRSTSPSSTTT